jgi:hypothetical protein
VATDRGLVCVDLREHGRSGCLSGRKPSYRNLLDDRALTSKRLELDMDQDTKHELAVLTLGTLAAIPVVTGLGLALVTGILAW